MLMRAWMERPACRLLTKVWVLYPALCVAVLPAADASKVRCGSELVADLELVCGDRGFYKGKFSGTRGGARQRGKGIVEQCCLRGCDLQHLESYCAKPQRNRRHTRLQVPPSTKVLYRMHRRGAGLHAKWAELRRWRRRGSRIHRLHRRSRQLLNARRRATRG